MSSTTPECAGRCGENSSVGQGMRVGAQVTEDDKAVAIVTGQTVLGTEPEEALGVLDNRAYHVVGETIGGRKVNEAYRGRPGLHRQPQAQGTGH